MRTEERDEALAVAAPQSQPREQSPSNARSETGLVRVEQVCCWRKEESWLSTACSKDLDRKGSNDTGRYLTLEGSRGGFSRSGVT